MQKMRFRLDSKTNFLTEREALERLTHYLNFTGEPQEADCTARQDASERPLYTMSEAGPSPRWPTAPNCAITSLLFNIR